MINLRSQLRQRLLGYYFTNPAAEHYLRELAAILQEDPANLSRELAGLSRQGLFMWRTSGRQKYFRLNRSYPLYEEFKRIVFKTVGVAGELRNVLERAAGVQEAYLYGSFARDQQDASSDIDVLIVGEPDSEKLEETMRKLERQFKREINYTVMSAREFQTRRRKKDAFLVDILLHKHINLFSS
jgi:predicted nucleotidyltransferase